MTTAIFLSLAGVSIIPILATLLFPKNRSFFERDEVRGFGLGVYLMLVVLLLRESVEHGGFIVAGGWFLGGLVLSILIGVTLKEFHHHHTKEERVHSHNASSTWRVLVSDFFHNIVDGIAIIAGFGISMTAGVTSFLGILAHQTVQQAGQQVLLVENNVKPNRAIMISFIVSLSMFLGFYFQGNEIIEVLFMALSSGIVAWKVGTDMMHVKWDKKMILGFMTGALILALILVLIPHEH